MSINIDYTGPSITLGSDGNGLTVTTGATINGGLKVTGDLTINGTTSTINSTTITVDDKNIELGSVDTPTDTTADGGGITLKGTTDKTIIWDNTNKNWTSSENLNVATGKTYKINNVDVLSSTTLGTSVVNSNLTKVGLTTAGFVKSDASGNLSVDTSTFAALGSTSGASLAASGSAGVSTTAARSDHVHPFPTAANVGAQPSNTTLTNIAALSTATTGFVKLTNGAASIDTATYVKTSDTGTVTNTMLAGSIAIAKLASSTISGVSLGSNLNALTIGSGLSGTSYDGSSAITIAIDSTVATLTGTQTLTNKTIKSARQVKTALASGAIDTLTGDYFTYTIGAATTFSVSNVPASGNSCSFILDLTNGGSQVITWWTGVKWAGGTAPTLTSAGRDVLGFFTHDGGTTWTGLVLSKDVK